MNNDKCKVFFSTLFINFLLIIIYYYSKPVLIDKIYIIFALISQYILFIGLYCNNKYIIDIIHAILIILLIISLILNNKYISGLCFLILLIILFFWIYYDRCIMYNDGESWGLFRGNQYLAYGTLILLITSHFYKFNL